MADDYDPLAVESPTWWLHRLCGKIARDQARMVLMDRYYRGDHPLPFVPRKLKAEFRAMLARSRSNFMRIVVDAPAERLRLQGFRPRGQEQADKAVWDWWVDSRMLVDSNIAITDAIKMARSYISVWRYEGQDDVSVQVEDPRGTFVEYDRKNRHKRVAALRVWNDDWTGKVRADVWLPDACYQFEGENDRFRMSLLWPPAWVPGGPIDDGEVRYVDTVNREDPAPDLTHWAQQWTELDKIANPWGEIPIVPLVNRESTTGHDGESEIDDVYSTQDRINAGLFNRDLGAWTTAYRQKWATGLDIPEDPETGEAIEPFDAAVDRLWASEDPNTKFGSFEATNPAQFIEPVEQDVKHIAVQTRTPRHYLVEQGQMPSGDSIKSAETGLVAKVEDKQPYMGFSFSEVVRLRYVMLGQSAPLVEAIWRNPQFRTLAEQTDSTVKRHAARLIPRRVAQEELGYTDSEIDRMEALFAQEELVEDARTAATPVAGSIEVEEEAAEELQVPVGA